MTNNPQPKRKYDSSRRKVQAKETRRQIVIAARGLFFVRGYSGTTIDAIAQAADVASETVYATFSNKRNILAYLMDITVGGDDQPIRLLDRSEPQTVLHETDPWRLIQMFSSGITEILARVAPLFEIMRSASKTEPDIKDLMENLLKERMENLTVVARQIASIGGLREGMEISTAAELVWTITSPEVFLLLTRDRNYSEEQYAAWLQNILARLLLS
jgi:AcrR family transcriptional regulator